MKTDIAIIIPSYKSQDTIERLLEVVDSGLTSYFPEKKSLIIVVDSSDATTQETIARKAEKLRTPTRLVFSATRVTKGRGIFKGFAIASKAGAQAVAMIDSDLKSIEPFWIKEMIEPVVCRKMDFVGPNYVRDKFDSLITNHIVYPFVRSFLRADLRQPIGGDFSFSGKIINFFLEKKHFQKSVEKYGIDIWLSFSAIVNNFNVGQVCLGTKDHGVTIKDPTRPEESLGKMFVEVTGTLFALLVNYEKEWKSIDCIKVANLNKFVEKVPTPVVADFANLWETFRRLYPKYYRYYRQILPSAMTSKIEKLYDAHNENTLFDLRLWVGILECYLRQYATTENKRRLLASLLPLYFARIACFVCEVGDLSNKEVEQKIQSDISEFDLCRESLKQER